MNSPSQNSVHADPRESLARRGERPRAMLDLDLGVSVDAFAATLCLLVAIIAGVARAQSDDDGSGKPTIDGSEELGVTPADVDELGKDSAGASPAAPSRAEPVPQSPPPVREAQRARPEPAPHAGGLFSGNPYLWGALGWVGADDADLSGSQSGPADLEDALLYGGALGWHFDHGLRTEIELSYFDADVGSLANSPVSGDFEVINAMANVMYELPLFERVRPYGGAGIGAAIVDAELAAPGPSAGEDTVFAYQFIGGAAVRLTRRIDLTLDYRYFDAEDPDFGSFESDLSGHKVLAGVRYTFEMPDSRRM